MNVFAAEKEGGPDVLTVLFDGDRPFHLLYTPAVSSGPPCTAL